MSLPEISYATPLSSKDFQDRTLIIAEGFESRSLNWISSQPESMLFQNAIICKYAPSQADRFQEMRSAVSQRSALSPYVLEYNRFEPAEFEKAFYQLYETVLDSSSELIIDISVMSKMLILIIMHALRKYSGTIRLIYSEPFFWSPSKDEYERVKCNATSSPFVALSSVGVYDVIKTPKLSSIVMQDAQALLIAFTSTNNHLINALLNTINPELTLLINAKNANEPWREKAALEIHQNVFREFPMYTTEVPCFDLLDFQSVFKYLAEIYHKNCYSRRLILSPTGGKIHAVACALIKGCCPDVHIEYPTPETYLFSSYSSAEIRATHEITFLSYSNTLNDLAREYKLNG